MFQIPTVYGVFNLITIDDDVEYEPVTENHRGEHRGVIWRRFIRDRHTEVKYYIYHEDVGKYCLRCAEKYPGELMLDGDIQNDIDRKLDGNYPMDDWEGKPLGLMKSRKSGTGVMG